MEESQSASSSTESTKVLDKEAKSALVNAIRKANNLPKCNSGHELYSSYPAYAKFMEVQREKIINLIRKISRSAGCRISFPSKVKDLDEYLERIVGANDTILERALIAIDECSRNFGPETFKPRVMKEATSEITQRSHSSSAPKNYFRTFASRALPSSYSPSVRKKPQSLYNIPVDNSIEEFNPAPKIKHNSIEAAISHLRIHDVDSGREWTEKKDERNNEHPYFRELTHFKVPEKQLISRPVIPLKSIDETTLIFVNDIEKLKELRDTLNNVEEFAVDLEHHSLRSYHGLTCLIQISTRDTDYIVDPFPLWNDIWILNEPFSNPSILKVFHGSDRDIIWLQRDFRIFVVNMFDTYFAMTLLNTSKRSLQYLVQDICNIHLDKKLRLADWTIRPFPNAFLDYARGDSHYLLYCYDNLREKILTLEKNSSNLLQTVYRNSALVCLSLYSKNKFDSEGYVQLLRGRRFNNGQRYALKELWQWRDSLARSEDESCHYVMPNHTMLQIAETLPREMQGIIASCSSVPVLIRQELANLHLIICAAREQPLERSLFSCHFSEKVDTTLNRMTKTNSLLRSHLDFTSIRYDEEIGSIMEQHIGSSDNSMDMSDEPSENISTIQQQVYEIGSSEMGEAKNEKLLDAITVKMDEWAAPYECYLIALKEEAENAAKIIMDSGPGVKNNEGRKDGKQAWSHLDPPVLRAEIREESISAEEGKIPVFKKKKEYNKVDESTLSKSALRRLRKRKRKSVDIPVELGASSSKANDIVQPKVCKNNWTNAPKTVSTVVDYEDLSRKFSDEKRFDRKSSKAYNAQSNTDEQKSKRRSDGKRGFGKRGSERIFLNSNISSFSQK